MGYSNKGKLSRRKAVVASNMVLPMAQRLGLLENTVIQLLNRENLSLAMGKNGSVELVNTPPTPVNDDGEINGTELDVTIIDEATEQPTGAEVV